MLKDHCQGRRAMTWHVNGTWLTKVSTKGAECSMWYLSRALERIWPEGGDWSLTGKHKFVTLDGEHLRTLFVFTYLG